MNEEIKMGDIVTLKSDTSVIMTIGNFGGGDDLVDCYYFLQGEIRIFTIRVQALQKVL